MKRRKPSPKQTRPPAKHDRRIPLGLEEIFREARGEPYTCFIRLTREMADDWITNHLDPEIQRPLSEDRITVLVRVREEGLWTDYQMQVVFDARHQMRNGQHSTISLIRPPEHDGFVIQLLINVPVRICDQWDQVQTRSAADQFWIKGYKENRYIFSKAAKVLWQYQHGIYDGMGYTFDRGRGRIAAPPEAVLTAEKNPELRECLFAMDKCFKGKQFSQAAVHAAYYVLQRIEQKKADLFFRCLNDGLGLSGRDDPRWALRNRFLSLGPKERLRNGETMALVVKAWNLYCAGEKAAGALKMGKNEPFPKLEPMEVPDGPHSAKLQ